MKFKGTQAKAVVGVIFLNLYLGEIVVSGMRYCRQERKGYCHEPVFSEGLCTILLEKLVACTSCGMDPNITLSY